MGINSKCRDSSSSLRSQIRPSTEQEKIWFQGQNVPPAVSFPCLSLRTSGMVWLPFWKATCCCPSRGWLCCAPCLTATVFPGRWTRASTGAARTASPRRTWRRQPARCQRRRKASRPWWWTTPTAGKQRSAWWLLTNLSWTPRRPKTNKKKHLVWF